MQERLGPGALFLLLAGQELKGPNQLQAGEDGWVGPVAANPADADATDIVLPRSLCYANASLSGPRGGLIAGVAKAEVMEAAGEVAHDHDLGSVELRINLLLVGPPAFQVEIPQTE